MDKEINGSMEIWIYEWIYGLMTSGRREIYKKENWWCFNQFSFFFQFLHVFPETHLIPPFEFFVFYLQYIKYFSHNKIL